MIRSNAIEGLEVLRSNLVLSQLLVSLGLAIVCGLVELVTDGILGGGQAVSC